MLVFALILLFFANHQPIGVLFDTSYTANLASDGGYLPIFLVGMFMALFVVYGFDTAGTFGEETLDAGRQAPRGVLSAIWLSGIVGAIFLLAVTLSFKDMDAAVASGQAFGFPIADDDPGEPAAGDHRNVHLRPAVPRRDPDRGLRLHAGDPGCDGAAHVLDGPRRPASVRLGLGQGPPDVQDPDERLDRRRRARRDPVLHHGRGLRDLPRDRRHGH